MENKKYICPVCGYSKLEEPAYDKFNTPSCDICSCCGCEFGFDDFPFEEARRKWINSKKFKKKFEEQLKNLDCAEVKLMIKNVEQYRNDIKCRINGRY